MERQNENDMKLYLIRHGETDWNKEGRMQGQTDIPLNEKGIELAYETAKGMQDIHFDLCISSPLQRARKTADIVLEGRDVPVIEEPLIQEICFGDWEGVGCRKHNYALSVPFEEFQQFYLDPFHYEPDISGESISQLCERTAVFWNKLISTEEYQDKTILIATHGCAMRALLHNVYEDKEDFWHGQVPVNCAVNVVEVTDGKAVLLEDDKVYYDPSKAVNFFQPEK